MKKISLCILAALMILSCFCTSDDEFSSVEKVMISGHSIDQKNFIFNDFYRVFQVKEIEKEEYLIGYNRNGHQLELYNLSQNSPFGFITLKKAGPDGVPTVSNLYVHNLDSIFILSFHKLLLINQAGKILKSIRINNSNSSEVNGINFDQLVFCGSTENMNSMYFDDQTNRLFIPTKSVRSASEEIHYQPSLFGYLDLNTLDYTPIDISYPEEFKDRVFPLAKPNISFYKERVIYNFPFSSEIFVYDINKRSAQSFPAKSKLSKNLSESIAYSKRNKDMELLREIFTRNPTFYKVIYDGYRKVYYRWHFAENDGGGPAGAGRRGPLVFGILDEDFDVIYEEVMENIYYQGEVSKKGLLVQDMNRRAEGFFNYSIINL